MIDPQNPGLSAVKKRRAEITQEIAALEVEDEELEVAERALGRLVTGVSQSSLRPLSPKDTVEDLVLGALERSKLSLLEIAELQTIIKDLSGREIPMSTLSPTVSKMKSAGRVVRDGLKIGLKERLTAKQVEDLLS